MNILRAQHLGMCFGVRDAIALARDRARSGPVSVLGDLVHNPTVLAGLRADGIQVVQQAAEAETGTILITAHGASDRAIARARARGLPLEEATCPLVRQAHDAVRALVSEGYHPVIVGKRDHVEVRGLTEDLAEVDVLLTEAEVFQLRERPRFGVAAQTTQPLQRVHHLAGLIRWRFPASEVRLVETVCQPTRLRQEAAEQLARQSEVVVVIGGAHSNNTLELVRTCARFCAAVYHIETAADLRPEWFAHAGTVGLTAGTSTPDPVIAAVESTLREWSDTGAAAPARDAASSLPALAAPPRASHP